MAGEEQATNTAKAGGHGLGKKLGPLPIWAWAAVIVGSYLLYHYLKNRSAAAGTTGLVGGTGTTLGTDNAGSAGSGNTTGGTTTSGTDTTTPQGWLAAAQNALQGLGLDNNTINGALNDFVSGQPLPQSEYNIVTEAIKIIGAAPSSLGNPSLAAAGVTGSSGATSTPPVVSAPANALAQLNAQSYPLQVLFGNYSPSDYTQVGFVGPNGTYAGSQVSGGAPVYAGLFGGMEQDFNMSTLPVGTKIYVPTSLVNQGYAAPFIQPGTPGAPEQAKTAA